MKLFTDNGSILYADSAGTVRTYTYRLIKYIYSFSKNVAGTFLPVLQRQICAVPYGSLRDQNENVYTLSPYL